MAVRAITFDVYSALFDTVSSLTDALQALFRDRGIPGDAAAAGRTWRQAQREYLLVANSLDREPASNRKAIEVSARFALRALDPPLTDGELARLVAAWETLRPWPEVGAVLRALRARPLVLATLSNGDADMLERLQATLPVRFDATISSQGGKFKPHPSVYQKAVDTVGVPRQEILHVAGSAADAMGATAFGIRTVWVNRFHDAVLDPRFAPAYEIQDLRGLAEVLADLGQHGR